ncbi:MAG: glycosyl hydrolase [Gemmatimonadota bacterium]|nr:glycosyl hydrolase [Gemmatimonadota bacterium]
MHLKIIRAISLATAIVLEACHSPARPRVAAQSTLERAPAIVHAWLTTGDRTRLLNREADLNLSADTAAPTPAIATIDVDAAAVYQQIVGFGAAMTDASAFLMMHRMPAKDREVLLQDLFGRDSGIALSFIRVPMGASDFSIRHYSYDDMPAPETDSALAHFSIDDDRVEKIPLLKRALEINPQIKLVASPWSPPAWMKTSGSLIKGSLLPRFYDSFAEYFVKFIRAYGAAGLPIYALTVQNEPNFEPENYPGMRLEAAARARVIGDHLGPRLERAGIRTMIWDWDHNWDVPQSPMEVLADPRARKYVQGVAWHCYGGDVSAQSKVVNAFPGKDTWFTECSGGEWAPNFADNLTWNVGTLVIGATRNWARGVALWNLALDEKAGPHKGGCGNCRGVVTIDSKTGAYTRNVEYYALAHASKFVRPGARRIRSESADTTLANVAFQNPDGYTKVLIVVNPAKEARTFAVRWLGRVVRYTLPAGSVVTFIWG